MRALAWDSRIEAIAGEPVVDVGAGSLAATATTLDASAGVSMYTVVDVTSFPATIGGTDIIAQLGQPLNDGLADTYSILRTVRVGAASTEFEVRRTGGLGPVTTVIPALGAYVIAWGLTAQLQQTITVPGVGSVTDTVAMAYGTPVLLSVAASALHTHLRTLGYSGAHTAWQRAMILARLAQQYSIPAG